MLDFHTHSEGTRKIDQKYMKDFSSIDENSMKKNPDLVFMLVTPETIKARKGNSKINITIN